MNVGRAARGTGSVPRRVESQNSRERAARVAAETLLHRTDESLRSALEGAFDAPPNLVVPRSPWLSRRSPAWSGRARLGSRVLVRRSGYHVDGLEVSRHLAAINASVVPEPHRTILATAEGDLGESIAAFGWVRSAFVFDDGTDDATVLRALTASAHDAFRPLSWRRYEVRDRDRLVAVVLEALTWNAWNGKGQAPRG
jgi:hypothetical protein